MLCQQRKKKVACSSFLSTYFKESHESIYVQQKQFIFKKTKLHNVCFLWFLKIFHFPMLCMVDVNKVIFSLRVWISVVEGAVALVLLILKVAVKLFNWYWKIFRTEMLFLLTTYSSPSALWVNPLMIFIYKLLACIIFGGDWYEKLA